MYVTSEVHCVANLPSLVLMLNVCTWESGGVSSMANAARNVGLLAVTRTQSTAVCVVWQKVPLRCLHVRITENPFGVSRGSKRSDVDSRSSQRTVAKAF